MILKTINILTLRLTKNLLTFISLALTLSTFARDIPPHILKERYFDVKYDINYDDLGYNSSNDENETNLLEPSTTITEDEVSATLVSPTFDTENVFFPSDSNDSDGEFIFGEDDQLDYPVFADDNDLLSKEALINHETEDESYIYNDQAPNENFKSHSPSNDSTNNLFVLNPDSYTSTETELELELD
jgi:hypothetical protein